MKNWCFAGLLPALIIVLFIAKADAAPIWKVDGEVSKRSDSAAVTLAIQSQIDACSQAGGGRVEVPAGDYHLKPIQLRSNVELNLASGAVLIFSRNVEDYPLMWIDDGRGPEAGCRAPVSGDNLNHVSITGSGIIDGQGDAWRSVKKAKLSPQAWEALVKSGGVLADGGNEWFPSAIARDSGDEFKKLAAAQPPTPLEQYAKYRLLIKPNLVRLVNCKTVRLEGVTFRNSALWNIHLALCDQVDIRAITIFNVAWAQNGDGIDLDSCRDVTMADSTVNAGDDGICLKSGMNEAGRRRNRPTENITITHCTVGTGHGGVVIGSEMSGGVRHVKISDCVFTGTDNGLRFKSTRGRGGVVEDVTVTNIKMSDIHGVAVLFDLYYMVKSRNMKPGDPPPAVDDGTPAFRDFHIQDITCDGAGQALLIRGLPEMPLRNITLTNVKIKAKTAGIITDARGIVCDDVHIEATDGSLVAAKDAPDLKVENSSGFGK